MRIVGSHKSLAHRPKHISLQDYNCGGYAFRTYDWLGFRFSHSYHNVRRQVRELLKAFPQWELCEPPFDYKNYEYVAFRWGVDRNEEWSDFHFARSWKNGTWHGKEGEDEIVKIDNILKPWIRTDGAVYNKQIFFFRKKRGR